MANVLSIVSYKIFPARFGGQKGIANFNDYFSKYHQLFCITVKSNENKEAPYTILNLLGNTKLRYINIFYVGLIRKFIRQFQVYHIIVEHPYYGWLGLLLKKFCRVKMIVHSHNIESERFKTTGRWWWKILWHYEKFVHKNADFTFCITEKDREYFINQYKLLPQKTATITFGISWNEAPPLQERLNAKIELKKKYSLKDTTIIYLFNGALDYQPNLEAVKNITEKINPLLLSNNLDYVIIICGKNLPAEMNELKIYADKNIIYAGFVEDISLYFKGSDIFINPVTDGGGIKTKLVEALGYNLNAVSTMNGAIGVDEKICNEKLVVTQNEDWEGFARAMQQAIEVKNSIDSNFFNQFYWDNIARKAASIVDGL